MESQTIDRQSNINITIGQRYALKADAIVKKQDRVSDNCLADAKFPKNEKISYV